MKLKAPKGRIIVTVDLESKNTHTFEDGTKIRLERQYDNFNMRYVRPVNATVVSAENVPEGAEILIHHNATHDTYKIFNFQPPTKESSSDIKYFSVPLEECFLWRKDSFTWNTMEGFVTALRIFEPYNGILHGVEPKLIKNRLYVTSGDLKGKVVQTVRAADYEIIFNNQKGIEERIIRVRHSGASYFIDKEGDLVKINMLGDGKQHEREEVLFVDLPTTKKIKNGEILVGISISDCKKIV